MPRPTRPIAAIAVLAAALYCATVATAATTQAADTAAINTSALASVEADSAPLLPRRAVVLHGDIRRADNQVVQIYFSREGLSFNEAEAPRFLLLDRKGRIAFGIGGTLYATASTDFSGAIDSRDFATADIAVPNTDALARRFGADVSNSSLYVRLVGRSPRLGLYTVYIRSNFTGGGDGGYGFRLKQAYIRLKGFTIGLDNSTFVDAGTQAPTIDPQGPSGQVGAKNVLFRYTTPAYRGFRAALSIEVPRTSYSTGTYASSATTRVPDIPLYIQYGGQGGWRVRLGAIYRDLAYRDLAAQANRRHAGWGVHLGATAPLGIFKPFGHIAYGHGIASYINDLDGRGLDLVPDADTPGRLKAPETCAWAIGTYIYFSPRTYMTATYSRAQVGSDAATAITAAGTGTSTVTAAYRYGQYICANAYYEVDDNFRLGIEYIHGTRANFATPGAAHTGHANRLGALLRYSF